MKKIVRYVIIHYLLTMFNTNKEVKDDICRSRFALFINNIKRDIKRRRHHYREPSRIPIKAALKHCGFVGKEKHNNDGYTRSMEINKATFMHHAKMPAGHLVDFKNSFIICPSVGGMASLVYPLLRYSFIFADQQTDFWGQLVTSLRSLSVLNVTSLGMCECSFMPGGGVGG